MDVSRLKIDVGRAHAQKFLQWRSRAVDSCRNLSPRVDAACVLLAIEQQDLAVVVIRDTINRPLAGQRTQHIIALAQQPLGQDRLAYLPLLLPEIRQRKPRT